MKNPFAPKCPVCRSSDLKYPDGFMLPIYVMKPIECNECGAKLEHNIAHRIGLWVFMCSLFLFGLTQKFVESEVVGLIFLVYLGLIFSVVVVGAVAELFRPRQFTLWSGRNKQRALVNYGSLISFLLYGVIFYSYIRSS